MRKKNATNLTSLFLLIFVFGYVISGLALDPNDLRPPPPDNPA